MKLFKYSYKIHLKIINLPFKISHLLSQLKKINIIVKRMSAYNQLEIIYHIQFLKYIDLVSCLLITSSCNHLLEH